jgi:thiamine-phosphate pyrophosphorylase
MICLVTDRKRLAGGDLAAQVRDALDLGIDLIHVRERDLEAGALAALVAELLLITKGTSTRLVVNDRIDVALACGADGVQLRGDSIPVAAARRIAPPGFLIGRSVHSVREAIAAAAAADYLVAGTVFSSASKAAGTPLLGVEGLRAIVRAVDRPVLAIGGVTDARLGEVADAGAAGFAAIGLFLPSHSDAEVGGGRMAELRQIVKRARSRFDRLKTTP